MKKKSPSTPIAPVVLYVATDGNDRWSGALPKANAAKTDGPLATVHAAQAAARKLLRKKARPASISIQLRGGTYLLDRPLVLTPEDCAPEYKPATHPTITAITPPITWAAYGQEVPVLSGGRIVSGWKETTVNGVSCWVASLPQVKKGTWFFSQLWVNGERRTRPILRKDGSFYRIEEALDKELVKGHRGTQTRFVYAEGDLDPTWTNLADVDIHIYNYWVDPVARIKTLDPEKRICTLDRSPGINLNDEWTAKGACYLIENVFEAMKKPGEWYLDRAKGLLYYIPKRGETMRNTEIIAPVLETVLRVEGPSPVPGRGMPIKAPAANSATPTPEAANIDFTGIIFAHTEFHPAPEYAGSMQAACDTTGTVSLKQASNIRFNHCAIRHTGAYGLAIEGCTEIAFLGGDIADTGAGGIKAWHDSRRLHFCDNDIGDGGHIFASGVGVLIGQTIGTRLVHNHIHDFFYSGVSVGWRWGFGESNGYGNIIEWNHIHDIGKGMLSDMGGIYCLGIAPGTRLRYNLIHDINSRTYGGWGLYTDEGSTHVLIENNIAYNTKCGGFHQHYGSENEVRNNIFGETILEEFQRSRLEPHSSFTFERNIAISDKGVFWRGNFDAANVLIQNNMYWRPDKDKKQTFASIGGYGAKEKAELSFSGWQKRGLDKGSLVTDPGFMNAAKGDFRFRKGSPYAKIGFIPFDLLAAGVRKERRVRGYTGGIVSQNSEGMWG